MIKITLTHEIPDGDYCCDCQFVACNSVENAICTLFNRVELDSSCDFYQNQNKDFDCQDCLCCECPASVSTYAKCDECRDMIQNLHRRNKAGMIMKN